MTAKAKMIVASMRRWFSDPLRNQYVAKPMIAENMDMDRERLRLEPQFWHFGFFPGHRSFFTSDIADLLQDGQELRFILKILPVFIVPSIPKSDCPLRVVTSIGRRNTFIKFLCRRIITQSLPRAVIESLGDGIESILVHVRQVHSLREVLPQ